MNLLHMYWRRALRRPGSIIPWIALPFVFMMIYTLVFGDDDGSIPKTGVAVVDEDSTFVSQFVSGSLSAGPLSEIVEVHPVDDLDQVQRLFQDEKASAALVIPAGFSDSVLAQVPVTLTLYENPRHFVGPQVARGVAGALITLGNGLIGVFSEPLRDIQRMVDSDSSVSASQVGSVAQKVFTSADRVQSLGAMRRLRVTVADDAGGDDQPFDMAAMFFPGLIMFGLLSVSLSLETRFLIDRTRRVTHRLVTAPFPPWRVVAEQRLFAATFLYLVALVSGLLGGLVWKIPPLGLADVNLIVIALIMFIIGINGTIYSLSRSIKASGAVASFVMMALVIVGGGFFPAEFAGEGFAAFSRTTPTGMATAGLTHALTGRELGISIPVLYAYGLVFLAISIVTGRKRLV